jgi:hypothetical protein
MQSIGVGLLVVGGILLIIGLVSARKTKNVSADHGSVAVGGDNNAPITVTATQRPPSDVNASFWTVWNIATGVATLLGLALTLWPTK